jgi:hypothetical protein
VLDAANAGAAVKNVTTIAARAAIHIGETVLRADESAADPCLLQMLPIGLVRA